MRKCLSGRGGGRLRFVVWGGRDKVQVRRGLENRGDRAGQLCVEVEQSGVGRVLACDVGLVGIEGTKGWRCCVSDRKGRRACRYRTL